MDISGIVTLPGLTASTSQIITSSYLTVDEGDAYAARELTSSWLNASFEEKVKASSQATRLINQLPFSGDKTDADQLNEFPRSTWKLYCS